MSPVTRGPIHRWFAWRPVNTEDRGWRWLRFVNRRAVYYDFPTLGGTGRTFAYSVTGQPPTPPRPTIAKLSEVVDDDSEHEWTATLALVTNSPSSHRWCPSCGLVQVFKFSGWTDLIQVTTRDGNLPRLTERTHGSTL